jgi:hypothetical protein
MSTRSVAGNSRSFAKVSLNMCLIPPRTVEPHKLLAALNGRISRRSERSEPRTAAFRSSTAVQRRERQ